MATCSAKGASKCVVDYSKDYRAVSTTLSMLVIVPITHFSLDEFIAASLPLFRC